MVPCLFPNFLHDAAEYERAEQFWQQKWHELVTRLGEDWLWETPWLGTTFANGTPCRDGNPIFSAVSHFKRLGIRVVQMEPKENPQEPTFWTDQFDESEEAMDELVIACVLSPQNVTTVIDIMSQWITTGEVRIVPGRRSSSVPRLGERVEVLLGPKVAAPSGRRRELALV